MLKRAAVAAASGCVLAGAVVAAVLYRWTHTEHGKLDFRSAVFAKLSSAALPRFDEVSLEEYREGMNAIPPGHPPEIAGVEDLNIPGPAGEIPIRVYTPEATGPVPIVVFYHGGGWVVGSIDSYDNMARFLAKKSSSVVVSVGYRLAPEHPFPAAPEDAYSALEWVSRNSGAIGGDPDRIAVAGDSAGGNLAAVVALMSRDRGGPELYYQVLIYPVTDVSRMDTESYENFAEGFFLTRSEMEWFRSQYLPDEKDWVHPYASPLLAEDHAGLPPAMIITAQFDPLRDEGEAYAHKLHEDGVPVDLVSYQAVIHGFMTLEVVFEVMGGGSSDRKIGPMDILGEELQKAMRH